MTLRSIPLDDLRWDDLARIAREQLVSVSDGQWTLHAPVDPGVTILEAYAWQLEQRLFRATSVPDHSWWRVIELFDLVPPSGPSFASTVLTVEAEHNVLIGAETPARLSVASQPLTMYTAHSATIVAGLSIQRVVAGGTDVTLRLGELPTNPQRPGLPLIDVIGRVGLAVEMESALLATGLRSGGWLSMFIGLDPIEGRGPGPIAWFVDEKAGNVRYEAGADEAEPLGPPLPMTWALEVDGVQHEVDVHDGTAGFRRSGVVLWRPPGGTPPAARATLLATTADPWAGAEPRLRRLELNAMAVVHRRGLTVDLADMPRDLQDQFGSMAGIAGETVEFSALTGGESLVPGTVELDVLEADGIWYTWEDIVTLALAGPADRRFELSGPATITFGNDVHGRVPRLAASRAVRMRAQVGGGTVTSVPAASQRRRQSWRVANPTQVIEAANVVAVSGGATATALSDWRRRQPAREVRRFVTANDVEQVLRSKGAKFGIARVCAAVGVDPTAPGWDIHDALTAFCFPATRTVTIGDLTRRPDLDEPLRQWLESTLRALCLAGQRAFVRGPALRPVGVAIHADRPASDDELARVELAVRRALHPTAASASGDVLPFGSSISPIALTDLARRELSETLAVEAVSVTVNPRPGCRGEMVESSCELVRLESFELPWVESVRWTIGGGRR